MTTLSREQLTTLLVNAGFPKDSQTVNDMVGIAYAESGGDPSKHNAKPPDDSYGLWQINMLGSMGPDRRKKFGISSNEALYDPATNAKAAYIIYKEQGLNAWTTYKSGAYLKHMDGMSTPEGGNSNPLGGALSQFQGLASSIDSVGQNLFKGMANIVGILVALTMLTLGIIVLATQHKKTGDAIKTIQKVKKVVG